jgi:uncharacterized membrane protein YdjX (TVP38/TMEM64 family)
MSFLRLEYIKRNKIKAFIYLLVFCVVGFLFYYFGGWIKALFTSSEAIRNWVMGYGRLAPLALFLFQVVQVIVAPLNDFLTNLAGGYIFGPYYGFLYNYFGWVTGAIIVFWLVRFFGRGFINFFISEKKLKEFDDIAKNGVYIIFILFLLPIAPDDILVYIVGLTKSIKFKTFLWIILIGKIPGKLATSFLGAGIANKSISFFLVYGVFIAISVVIFIKKPELWRISKSSLKK